MALNQDMAKLAAEFGAAWDERAAAIAGIRIETATELAESREARAAMASEQDKQLKASVAATKADVAAMKIDIAGFMGDLADGSEARREDTAAMLSDMDAAHGAMAAQQHAQLSHDRARLASDGAADREERLDDVAGRRAGWTKVTAVMAKRRARAARPTRRPRARSAGRAARW